MDDVAVVRSRTTRLAMSAVVAICAVVLAACSGDDGDAAPSDPDDTTSTEAPPEDAPDATTVEELLAMDRPIVLAHAGGENAGPHSTMHAYERAVAAGVDALDVDLRLSSDGVVVVFHDETVDRTTGSTGAVADMTYDELHELDAAYWFTEACSACTDQPRESYELRGVRTGDTEAPEGAEPDDFGVLAFEDLLERFPEHVMNIEIKGEHPTDVPTAEAVAELLVEHDRTDAAVATAFDDELAAAFAELAPGVAITPGLDATSAYVLTDEAPPADQRILQIPPEYEGVDVLTADLVQRAHGDGLVLWIWPNSREWEDAAGYERLLDLGVDGINAADPGVAVDVVRSSG